MKAALKQIEDKRYEAALLAKGIEKDRIRKLAQVSLPGWTL